MEKDKAPHITEIARQAGFTIWDDCSWACERVGKIDWSYDYDEELANFYALVRDEVIRELCIVK